MRKTISIAVLAVSMVAVLAPHAGAVTGNYQRDFVNTGVGLIVSYDRNGEFMGRCSGTLLTPTVFLTAGHCTYGARSARVYFQQDAGANYDPVTGIDPVSGYPERGGVEAVRLITHPDYDDFATFPNTSDVAVVILKQAVKGVRYGALPSAGTLDRLAAQGGKRGVAFTVSGYGVNWINPAQMISLRERMAATATLTNLRSNLTDGYNLAHSGNPGGDKGGTCFGDSGGPVFLGSTDVIAGVTSFGMSAMTCTGPGYAYRTDRQEIIDWVLAQKPRNQTIRVVTP